MNAPDRTPHCSYVVSEMPGGIFLTPSTGIIHVADLALGPGLNSAVGLPFERINNPSYHWDVTRNIRPSTTNSRRGDRVLAWARTPDKYLTFGCTGVWSWWNLDWSEPIGNSFILGGSEPFPPMVEEGDLYLDVSIGDAGEGYINLSGSLTSSLYGTKAVGGAIVGWLLHEPVELFVGMLPEDAHPSLRPYVYSYCNR